MNKQLKAIRLARGLTQQQLADLVGDYKHNISAIENGRISPSIDRFNKLVAALRYEIKLEEMEFTDKDFERYNECADRIQELEAIRDFTERGLSDKEQLEYRTLYAEFDLLSMHPRVQEQQNAFFEENEI